MSVLRRPGRRSVLGVAAKPLDSAPVTLAAAAASRSLRRGAAARRGRRRRRLLIAAPFLGFLSWAAVSYAVWMLEPTSMPFGVRSVEWVRADMPFGNWIVDHVEQAYYSSNA